MHVSTTFGFIMAPHNDQFQTSQLLGNVERVTCQVYRLFCPFKPFWFSSEKLVLQLWTLVLCHLYLFCSSDRSACRRPLHRGQGALNITSYLIHDFEIIQLVFDLLFYLVLFCNWQNPSNLCSTELFPFVLKNCSKVWTKVSTMPFDRGAVECVYDTVFFLKLAIFSRWLRPGRYIVMHLCRVHTNTYHIEEQMTLRWCWTLLVGGQLSLLNCCIIYM